MTERPTSKRPPFDRLAQLGVVAILLLVIGYGYSWAMAIAIDNDPIGLGGVASPDGLEGMGIVLAILALPFVILAAMAVQVTSVTRRARLQRQQYPRRFRLRHCVTPVVFVCTLLADANLVISSPRW